MTRLRLLVPHAALRTSLAVYIAARPTETKATILCGFAKSNRHLAEYPVIARVFEEVWSKRP